jgi:hypothetical protein
MDSATHLKNSESTPQDAVQLPQDSDTERRAADTAERATANTGTLAGEVTPPVAHQHLVRIRTSSMNAFAERLVDADEALSVAMDWVRATDGKVAVEVLHS